MSMTLTTLSSGRDLIHLKRSTLLTILLVIVVVGAVLGGWIWIDLPTGTTVVQGEIRVYNGQELDSINDFRNEAIKGNQYIDVSNYTLTVTGLVQHETVFTYNDVLNRYAHTKKVVTLHCVEGWEVTVLWEGVQVQDLLEEGGYNESAQVLILTAQDGYTTSLPLSYIINNDTMIAFKVNGLALLPNLGFPFQLVAEGKQGYKWIKWITKMEVSNDVNFRGFWESRGFDNDANLP